MCDHETHHTPDPTPALTTRRSPVSDVGRALVYGMVYTYRYTLGPFIGGQCRFQPTCSQYMLDAVDKHGPVKGFFLGLRRITRCHPWSHGGHDPA